MNYRIFVLPSGWRGNADDKGFPFTLFSWQWNVSTSAMFTLICLKNVTLPDCTDHEVLGDASVCLPMMTKNENIKTCNKHHFASCLNHHCKDRSKTWEQLSSICALKFKKPRQILPFYTKWKNASTSKELFCYFNVVKVYYLGVKILLCSEIFPNRPCGLWKIASTGEKS